MTLQVSATETKEKFQRQHTATPDGLWNVNQTLAFSFIRTAILSKRGVK